MPKGINIRPRGFFTLKIKSEKAGEQKAGATGNYEILDPQVKFGL